MFETQIDVDSPYTWPAAQRLKKRKGHLFQELSQLCFESHRQPVSFLWSQDHWGRGICRYFRYETQSGENLRADEFSQMYSPLRRCALEKVTTTRAVCSYHEAVGTKELLGQKISPPSVLNDVQEQRFPVSTQDGSKGMAEYALYVCLSPQRSRLT